MVFFATSYFSDSTSGAKPPLPELIRYGHTPREKNSVNSGTMSVLKVSMSFFHLCIESIPLYRLDRAKPVECPLSWMRCPKTTDHERLPSIYVTSILDHQSPKDIRLPIKTDGVWARSTPCVHVMAGWIKKNRSPPEPIL